MVEVAMSRFRWLESCGDRHLRPCMCIRGTRITVEDVLELLTVGYNVEEIAHEYRIPVEAVCEAVKYAIEVVKTHAQLIDSSSR